LRRTAALCGPHSIYAGEALEVAYESGLGCPPPAFAVARHPLSEGRSRDRVAAAEAFALSYPQGNKRWEV